MASSYCFPGVPGCKAYYQVEGDIIWVTFTHGLPQTIPPIALKLKEHLPSDYPTQSDDWGSYLDLEPGHSPDWYRSSSHYFTWAPAPKAGQWYDISSSGSLTGVLETTEPGVWRVPRAYAAKVDKECREAIAIAKHWWKFVRQDPRMLSNVPFPDTISVDALQSTYTTEKQLREAFAKIQRQFVGAIGALRWLLLVDIKWIHSLNKMAERLHEDLFASFLDWDLLKRGSQRKDHYIMVPGGRGLYIDPMLNWRHISLPLYIENQIPLSYPWTPGLQSHSRFLSLSPRHTGAVPMVIGTLYPTWYSQLEESDHFAAFFTDKYLQAQFDPTLLPVTVKGKGNARMDQYVVRFEQWMPGKVFDQDDRQRLLHTTFYREWGLNVPIRGTEPSLYRRVLYEHRPYRPHGYRPEDEYVPKEAPLKTHVMREVLKFTHAPAVGQKSLYSQNHQMNAQNEDFPETIEDLPVPRVYLPPKITPPNSPYTSSSSEAASSSPSFSEMDLDEDFSHLSSSLPIGADLPPSGSRSFLDIEELRGLPDSEMGQDAIMTDLTSTSPKNRPEPLPLMADQSGRYGISLVGMKASISPPLLDGMVDQNNASPLSSSLRDSNASSARRERSPTPGEVVSSRGYGGKGQARTIPRLPSQPPAGWSGTQVQHAARGPSYHGSSPFHALRELSPPRAVIKRSQKKLPQSGFSRGDNYKGSAASRAGNSQSRPRAKSSYLSDPRGSSHPYSRNSSSQSHQQAQKKLPRPIVDDKLARVREAGVNDGVGQPQWGSIATSPGMTWTKTLKDTILAELPHPLLCIPHPGPWDESFLDIARIHFPAAHSTSSEALMRLIWRQENCSLKQLLNSVVRMGIPFEAALSFEDLRNFTLSSQAPCTPRYYASDYKEPVPIVGSDAAKFSSWVVAAEAVLTRPHSCSVLYRGGLLWRIALEIRPELMDEITKGPSYAAILFSRSEELATDRHIEMLSQDEINVLLGKAATGQCSFTHFPTELQFFGMIQWRGYWDEKCEEWFKNRWYVIAHGEPRAGRRQWTVRTKAAKRAPKHRPALQAILEDIRSQNGVSWSDMTFRDLAPDHDW